MQSPFIYSTSRVNTLSQYLLSKTDIDRLLVAAPGADMQSALKETYLAPYVLRVDGEDVSAAIELTLIEAKKLIHRVAPQGNMFRVLWVQYDIHNLRIFAKARAENKQYGEVAPLLSERGIYTPAYLFEHVENSLLNRLQSGWQEAFDAAVRHVEAGELDLVDVVLDELFFSTLKRIAAEYHDAFLGRYCKRFIDLYNLKGRLRAVTYPQMKFAQAFVSGGNFAQSEIESKEQVLQAFASLGSDSYWRSALDTYQETGHTTQIDARADEYLVDLAKQASVDMFSSASLVAYYLLCRQAAANIRTIVVGKNSGMDEASIRTNLRMSYVIE